MQAVQSLFGAWFICAMAMLVSACESSPVTGAATVSGTATYRERMALPDGSEFEAALQDVSRADAGWFDDCQTGQRLPVAPEGDNAALEAAYLESAGGTNALADDLFYDRKIKLARSFPNEFRRIARRKLLYLHDATGLQDLRVPPGNRLEALKGNLRGFHSLRISDQWRLVFRWSDGQSQDVQIVDYHR